MLLNITLLDRRERAFRDDRPRIDLTGKNVILVAHGNSLRSLVMHLDRLSPEQVKELTISTGMPLIYRLRPDGTVAEKRDLAA